MVMVTSQLYDKLSWSRMRPNNLMFIASLMSCMAVEAYNGSAAHFASQFDLSSFVATSHVESPGPQKPGAPPAMTTKARSSASGKCTRCSVPDQAAVDCIAPTSGAAGAPAGARRLPKVRQISSSSICLMSAIACCDPSSSTGGEMPPASSSWLIELPTLLKLMDGRALLATSSSIAPRLPSCAWAALLACPNVRRLTWSKVASQSQGSRGYMSCFNICIALPSMVFSRALAAPLSLSWASTKPCRSNCGDSSMQRSHSSAARQDPTDGAKWMSVSMALGRARKSALTECKRL
mmetsp:Transcript_65176/g.187360  ORF Transcript_65176/g.187360 Transcript_65176/m.187360 type:complete len:293 (+) Transcript_65176:541-1419(+)